MSDHLPNDPTTAVISSQTETDFPTPTKPYPSPEAEYEEITQNPEILLQKLQGFHKAYGTKFKVPTLGGKALDLHRLFVEVTSRGGIEKVIRDRKWKEVIATFNFPPTITSASFVLRKYYLSSLYHFEQVYYFRKKAPTPLKTDSASKFVNGLASLHGPSAVNQFSGQTSPNIEVGSLVTGTIDAKFDNGYLITVNFGSEKLNGVLYHIMPHSSCTSAAPSHGNKIGVL